MMFSFTLAILFFISVVGSSDLQLSELELLKDMLDQNRSGNSIMKEKIFNIGLVLSPNKSDYQPNSKHRQEQSLEILMQEQLSKINEIFKSRYNDQDVIQFRLLIANLVPNPIEMGKIICQQLIGNEQGGVHVVIVDTDDQFLASVASISFTLGLYDIPVIGTTLRDSSLFNKNLHSTYISLIPPHSHQADVWLSLTAKLKFKKAFVLTSTENNDLLSRLVHLIDRQRRQQSGEFGAESESLKLESIIEHDSASFIDEQSARQHLTKRISGLLENNICRVFLVHAKSKHDVQFFVDILNELNMTSGFALIFSEDAHQVAVENSIILPSGSITSKLSLTSQTMPNKAAYALDALDLAVKSLNELVDGDNQSELSEAISHNLPNSCNLSPASANWQAGIELYLTILRQTFSGHTGSISFDENGDRLSANYDLLNLVAADDNLENGDLLSMRLGFANSGGMLQQTIKQVGLFRNGQESDRDSESAKDGSVRISSIELDVNQIEWPGGERGHLISGVFVNRHLRIITLQEKPFIWVLESKRCWMNEQSSSGRLGGGSGSGSESVTALPCWRANPVSGLNEKLCCIGYCMDLLKEISHRLNFTFDLYLTPDNLYGSLSESSTPSNNDLVQQQAPAGLDGQSTNMSLLRDSSEVNRPAYSRLTTQQASAERRQRLRWNGLMGELVSRRADMAFAPLTITAQRALAVDFSKPFKFHGFSILLRRASKHTTLASFLQPFHNQLWILVIGVATHVVALTLYLLDRYSTFGTFGMRNNLIPNLNRHTADTDRPLHLTSSLWFSWSILLNSGVGEHTPKSLSGRVLGIFWSGFAMIVVASYTANLAAFLVLDSREETPTLSGIDDPRLRSGDLAFNFATVRQSAVDAYLQSQVEYINLYRKMEEFSFNTVDEAILALRDGIIDALIWDSTRLEWEVASDERCSLGIAGELFGSSGYGIGLQRDSYWTNNVTTKLLELHESGFMVDLDKKWIASGASGASESWPIKLSGGLELDSSLASNNNKLDKLERGPSLARLPQASCERRNEDYPETLGIFNIAGVFILFAGGLIASFGLIVVERLCYQRRAFLGGLLGRLRLSFGGQSRSRSRSRSRCVRSGPTRGEEVATSRRS